MDVEQLLTMMIDRSNKYLAQKTTTMCRLYKRKQNSEIVIFLKM